MSITNGQVITESDLTTAFNAQINTLSSDATSSFGFSQINMDLQDVLASTDVNARTYEFIAVDDCKLSEIAVYVGEGSGVWTIRISSPNLADDIVLSETVGSAAYNFTRWNAASDKCQFLNKGATYTIIVETTQAAGSNVCQVSLGVVNDRRRF